MNAPASRSDGTTLTWADGFTAGQRSVRRKNQSGCCCQLDEVDDVVSPCQAHTEWLDKAVAARATVSERGDSAEPSAYLLIGTRDTYSPRHEAFRHEEDAEAEAKGWCSGGWDTKIAPLFERKGL